MASLSADTQAIIDRLKAEGDLIRNSGTNSVKSVNIKLEKFNGLFESINANIEQQTNILRLQSSIAQENLEKSRNQEQLDEISNDKTKEKSDVEKSSIDAVGNRIETAITNAFSLKGILGGFKNIALGAAGIFVGYQLLKGFIDEMTGGKFTEFETKVFTFIKDFQMPSMPSFAQMQAQIDQMKLDFNTQMTTLNTNLSSIAASMEPITKVFRAISEMTWLDVASNLFLAFTSATTALAGLRWWFTRQRVLLNNNTRTPNAQNAWWRRLLGLPDPNAPKPTTTTPTTGQPYEDEIMRRQRAGRTGGTPKPATTTGGGRGTYGMNTPQERAQLRADAASSRAGNRAGLRLNSANRLVNSSGSFVSDDEALRMMQRTLDPRYSKVFANFLKIVKITGVTLAIVAAFQIYLILSDESLDDEGKMRALAPLFGGVLGAVGGAAIGAAIGTLGGVTAGWGTLILGLAGGVAGSLAGEQLGYYVAKWCFDDAPSEEEQALARQAAEAAYAASNDFSGVQFDGSGAAVTTPANDLSNYAQYYGDPSSAGPAVTVQPAAPTIRKPTMVPIGQYSSARLPGQMGLIEAGSELNGLDAISERNYRLQQLQAGANGGSPTVVISPTVNAPQSINVVEGAKSASSGTIVMGSSGNPEAQLTGAAN